MRRLRTVFMRTPDFAVPVLDARAIRHDVKAVFTQPDKPNGRKMKLVPSPVKKAAIRHGLDVYQPQSLRKGEDAEKALATLRSIAPDCIVVAAYGQILPKEILDLPQYGCINVHASLLPKYRYGMPLLVSARKTPAKPPLKGTSALLKTRVTFSMGFLLMMGLPVKRHTGASVVGSCQGILGRFSPMIRAIMVFLFIYSCRSRGTSQDKLVKTMLSI